MRFEARTGPFSWGARPAPAPPSTPDKSPAKKDASGDKWPFSTKDAVKRQDDAAKELGVPKEITLDLADKVKMKLALIPAGRFQMGSTPKEAGSSRAMAKKARFLEYNPDPANEGPQHEVVITKPFYMRTCHVTRGQFGAFAADSGFQTSAERGAEVYAWNGKSFARGTGQSWRNPGFEQTDEHPAVLITWADAKAFCAWLSKKSGRRIALPTEAQWKWACRAGTSAPYVWGDNPDAGAGQPSAPLAMAAPPWGSEAGMSLHRERSDGGGVPGGGDVVWLANTPLQTYDPASGRPCGKRPPSGDWIREAGCQAGA